MTDSNHQRNPTSTDSERHSGNKQPESTPLQMPPLLPSPEQIVAHLNRYVIGHEAAKRMLATACYDHLMQCAATDLTGGKVWADNHCVIAGPSGCGKSALVEVLGDFLRIPVFQIDCTNLSPNGYKGRNLNQVLDDFEKCLVHGDRTTPALVVWEEVDKLQSCGDDAGRYRQMVQADALRFLDGAMCGEGGTLNASRILSIGCGAFSGLDRIRNPDTVARIGFPTAADGHGNSAVQHTAATLQPDHLVQFGLMLEFVGRFSRFAVLDAIDRSGMRRIITDSESCVLRRKMAQFALHGVRLLFDDSAIDAVADKAMAHPTGARGLRMILGRVLAEWEFQLPGLADSGVTGIYFDERAVRGDGPPSVSRVQSQQSCDLLIEARRKAGSYAGTPLIKKSDDMTIF
jgi:ATP-dependent Clp protease ATP-binding subunit ClpX